MGTQPLCKSTREEMTSGREAGTYKRSKELVRGEEEEVKQNGIWPDSRRRGSGMETAELSMKVRFDRQSAPETRYQRKRRRIAGGVTGVTLGPTAGKAEETLDGFTNERMQWADTDWLVNRSSGMG
ncbi:hypothetical protein TESG_08327 [Trichophyton tonsurans CBS 112818]|uniref:Uncharacterized protein n=1 Tax=Trichophyton tonsurans (strain CBS 112818) TaxID=647933 RepID=F2RSZ4_TRIT1|nr:hypothetical protein TESG_08327 [Trichophyton tonsurans CBS 112818]